LKLDDRESRATRPANGASIAGHDGLKGFVVALLAVALAAAAGFLVWQVPHWQLAEWRDLLPHRQALLLENQMRQTLLLAAVALLVGLATLAMWRRARAAEGLLLATANALAGAQGAQRAERLTRAIGSLADERLEMRLGAIYLLERVAFESKEDHWPVVEVLCAYVRERAAWREDATRRDHTAADVQAVLTVLGRRERSHEEPGQRLDLRRADLRGSDLKGVDFYRARLSEAHLEAAALEAANLAEADLRQAFLSGADLVEANLMGANLREAHLEAAYLVEAHLENADLGGAHLEGAYLGGAFLEGADLGGAHLDGAYIYKAHLNGASLHGAHVVSTIGMTRREREKINRTTSQGARRPRRPRALRDRVEDDEEEEPSPTAEGSG
jgi:Pentapeptide repeats (8 copies)